MMKNSLFFWGCLGLLAVGCGEDKSSDDDVRDMSGASTNDDDASSDEGEDGPPIDGGGGTPDAGLRDSGLRDARADGASAGDGATSPEAGSGGNGCPADAPLAVNRVRIYPAAGKAARMVGGRIQGSNTGPTNDFVDLATIREAPAEGRYTELKFANDTLYRYIKYYAPEGSYGSIAELELYHDQTPLKGEGFGVANAVDAARSFKSALDGKPETAFETSAANESYVGLDIARGFVAATPTFSPVPGQFEKAPTITLASTTPKAQLRYTLDGSNPARTAGTAYAAPFALQGSRVTVKAVASAPCSFDSPVAEGTYTVGPAAPVIKSMKTYHIGNSLTDTINDWLEPIADSTGAEHTYARWTIPGSPLRNTWNNKGVGFGTPDGANNFDNFVRTFTPIAHLSVQPYSDPSINTEGQAAVEIFTAARQYSPDLQPWIYAQWPSKSNDPKEGWAGEAFANGSPWSDPPWMVPMKSTSWEHATRNQLLYHEAFAKFVDDKLPGKSVRIVPAGLALIELKKQIEAGKVPGFAKDEFFKTPSFWIDDLHLSAKTGYLVALTHYACFYQQSPEGRVTFEGTGLTKEQALIFQRIAWDTVRAYPLAGIGSP